MNTRLPDHLDLIAAALDGMQKLRGLILELAVRGKLVPQNPDDEPASELLKRIAVEKARLASDGKRRVGSSLGVIEDVEELFPIPTSWCWTRIGDVFDCGSGTTPSRSKKEFFVNGTENWVKTTDLNNAAVTFCEERITPEAVQSCNLSYYPPGTVCIAMYGGAGTIGKSGVLGFQSTINQSVLALPPVLGLEPAYAHYYVKSIRSRWMSFAAGLRIAANINGLIIKKMVMPVPPFPEQHRIVAKVDELMALCDRMEGEQGDAARAHAALVSSLLGTLTQSRDAAELAANWQRLSQHFDTLFTTEASLDALKQTILQLAVMGKLVPQDLNDEPASELLKRIAGEKARLVADGRPKGQRQLSAVAADERPFAVPSQWEWVRLGSLLKKIGAGSTPLGGRQVYVQSGIKFLRSQNVWDDGLRLASVAYVRPEVHEKMTGTNVLPGDLLFNITGASIGRCAIVPDDFDTGNVSQHVTIIRPVVTAIRQFLHILLISQHVQQTVSDVQVGVSREGLSIGKLAQFAIPLPPMAEQHRIVAKVDELMALCDRLKTDLAESRERQSRLAATLIESALQAA